ncbi:membralin-like protein At1g60995 isoform X2 [Typha latifolia]|uniref:membralin-like protein At1g60995 isoform X2 n=1 Tax=Typha latifolia TaxID=4733 RepID=UPI003C2E6712
MDPEQTFLRVHARLSGMLSQLLTPRIRLALEYMYLAVAIALFFLLVVMHTNFVQQPGCSSEFSGIEFTEAQLVQIKIISGGLWDAGAADRSMIGFQDKKSSIGNSKTAEVNSDEFTILTTKFWSNWIGSGARRGKLIYRSWKGDKEFLEPQPENTADTAIIKTSPGGANMKANVEGSVHHPLSAKESFKAVVYHFFNRWNMRIISIWKHAKKVVENAGQLMNSSTWNRYLDMSTCLHMLSVEHLNSLIVQWLEKRSKAFEPTYLYTVDKTSTKVAWGSYSGRRLMKGYFLLSEGAKSRHGVRTINITISAQNSCFGNRWQQLLINSIVGYDTILTNSLLSSPGQGYLYNFQTKDFYDLSYGHEPVAGPTRFGDYFVTKCGVLIMSLFVFFTTTMSVSFTLRETQSRMLKFTVQLQHHARHQLPTFQLIFVHVIESLVFVPIMIGILFFLFEFYDDQLLAFLVLTLVWLCELFTMISVRTSISMQFFPRFFLLYFLVFHIYFFSYSYGFSYLAFSATAAFMQHLILYFWNRFEVPALQRFIRSRGLLQQQTGVQITSSTIYTSTLHIARVNVRDTVAANNDIRTAQELQTGSDHARTGLLGPGETTRTEEMARVNPEDNTLQFPDPSPQQAGNAPGGSSLLNPFGSFLLWLLGGASSEGIISFFSMFRDVRDQGEVPTDFPQNVNEQVT